MLKIHWSRLLVFLVVTAAVSITLDEYFAIHASNVFIACLGVAVGQVCIQWKPQQK